MKNVEDVYKLSPRQQELLARAPHIRTGVEHLVATFRKAPDEAPLARAARELVARHPALRTSFFADKLKDPLQVVREKVDVAWQCRDGSGPDLGALVDAIVAEDRRRDANPSAPTLVRFTLARAGGGAALLLAFDPLVLDEASASQCVYELLALYEAALTGREPSEVERGRPYRDYIAWLEAQDKAGVERYYRARLGGAPDPAGPGAAAGEGPTSPHLAQQVFLSPAGAANVQGLLRQARLGLGTLVEAAWAIALRREGAGHDLVFGVRAQGRPATLPRAEAVVGRLAGTLPRRIIAPDAGPLRRFLRALEAENVEARPYEHASLGQIRAWAGLAPDAPLFHSVVAAEASARPEPFQQLGQRLGLKSITHLAPDPPWPLTVTASLGSRLSVRFSHDPGRVSAAHATRLAGEFAALLEAMADAPDRDIASFVRRAPREGDRPATASPGAGLGAAEIEAVLAEHPLVRSAKVAAAPAGGLTARIELDPAARALKTKKLRFSLFYFADATSSGHDKYRIYLEGAKFADRHGFEAVWTPERHFHENGGLYPNPSVLSAALATITERISLRAGSVVLPLHHPLRVAEEWSVVDNLSKGRAAISIASGWVPNDFAFAPGTYGRRRDRMFEVLEQVRRLWRGERLQVEDGLGNPTELRVFPRPIQAELPVWLTAAGSPDTFEKAGEYGCNILTSLLAQPLDEAAQKIGLYRAARERAGLDPATGTATMMLHAYVGADADEVLEVVRAPFTAYLRSHVALLETMVKSLDMQVDIRDPKLLDGLASFAFERYHRTSALIGTPTSCLAMLDGLADAGVDELACLIDFGVGADDVLESLHHLDELRRLSADEGLRTQRVLSEHLRERLLEKHPPVSLELAEPSP